MTSRSGFFNFFFHRARARVNRVYIREGHSTHDDKSWVNFIKFQFAKRKLLLISFIFLLIALPIVYLTFKYQGQVEAGWWNDNWSYRKAVSISNNTTFSGTNIPYKAIIDTATPIAAGKMQANANDIRVLDKDGKVVRYQIEQSTLNTTTTGLWFEGSIPANSTATYYVYYGNPSVTALSFSSDVTSAGSGDVIEMKDGFGYTTSTTYGRISDIRKNGANLGTNGNIHNSTSYPGNWWDDRVFTRTLLASGPLFVEVKFEDTNYGSYSSFGTNIKMFANGFAETRVFMNYNTSGSEQLYYYLSFDTDTRNSLWVDGSGTLIDQSTNSGVLTEASLGNNWFGQRWTATGNYGGTIITKNGSDWNSGQTSAQASYYQTNYSYTVAFTNGSSRQIRYGVFAGTGTSNEMSQKASLLGAYTTSIQSEEQSPGPVAYWKFDEGSGSIAYNSTPNTSFNGSINSGASWKQESECLSGKCLYMNQSDSDVDVTGINLDATQNWTVGTWVKVPAQSGSGGIWAVDGSHTLYLNSTGTAINTYWGANLYTISIPNDTWLYIVVTRNGNAFTTYINGVQKGTGSTAATTAGANMFIGSQTGSGYYMKGFIDEFKVYKYTRSAAEIKNDFVARGSVKGVSTRIGPDNSTLSNGLVSYWKSDEASGNGTDSSGNSNTSTVSGSNNYGVGKFGNGLRSGEASTNLNPNPSLETNSTGWTYWLNSGTGTAVRSTDTALFGSYSYKSTMTVNGSMGHYAGQTNVSSSTTYSVSGWIKITSWGGSNFAVYMREVYPTGNGQCGATMYTASGVTNGWVRFSGTCTTRADTTSLLVSYYLGDVGQVVYVDGIQIEQASTATPYIDGSLGTGYSWSGTAHASSSSRTASTTTTTTNVNNTTGTIAYWFNSPSLDTTAQCPFGPTDGDTNGGMLFGLKSSGVFLTHKYDSGVTVTPQYSSTLNNNTWYHVAYTWDNTTLKGNLYVNGALQQNVSYSQAITIGEYLQNLGTCTATGYRTFNGTIDEIRAYNRVLSPVEVSQLYNFAPGPIGYWNFEEGSGTNLYDRSGNGNNSTSFGGSPTWTSGKFGKALNFNGSTDFVSAGTNLGLSGDTQMSISAWFKTSDGTSGQTIDVFGDTIGLHNFALFLNGNGTRSISAEFNGGNGYKSASNVYTLNQWHHFEATKTPGAINTTTKMYLDGVEIPSSTSSTSTPNITLSLNYIGQWSNTGSFFNGQVDEVRIYNYARTPSQIVEDMNGGRPIGGSPVGSQFLYLKMDDGYGTTTKDSSPNAYNGTLTDGPTWTNSGKFAKGVTLDGLKGRIQGFTSNPFEYTGGDLSFSLWFKPNASDTDTGYLISKPWNGSGQYNYGLRLKANDTVDLLIHDGTSGINTVVVTSNKALTSGQWNYVTVTMEGSSKQVKIYINGALDNSATHSITNYAPSSGDGNASLTIGCLYPYAGGWAGNTTFCVQGDLDEIKFYSGLLTSEQVKQDYNHGSSVVWGASGTDASGNADNSSAREYCVPGDATSCSAPVTEWKFDEKTGTTSYDRTGNSNDGTFSGTPAWQVGKIGASVFLNGSTDYVSKTSFNSSSKNEESIEFWFKPASTSNSGYLYSSGQGSGGSGNYLIITQSNANVTFQLYNGSYTAITATSVLTANTWVHIAAVHSVANSFSYLYINGANKGSMGVYTDNSADHTYQYLGSNGGGAPFATGNFDNFLYYNYARTPAQVSWDYNRGGSVGWWKMDECQGVTANDASGIGNNGTITIGATGSQTAIGTCTTSGTAWGNGATGKYNSSLNLDGTDDYVSVNDNDSLDVTNQFTFSAFVYPTTSGTLQTILSKDGVGSDTTGAYNVYIGTDMSLRYETNNVDGVNSVANLVSLNQWNMLTITFDNSASPKMRFYINGVETTTGSPTAPSVLGTALLIGRRGVGSFVTGKIDDARIYNYPLTKTQVKNLYNGGAAIRYSP